MHTRHTRLYVHTHAHTHVRMCKPAVSTAVWSRILGDVHRVTEQCVCLRNSGAAVPVLTSGTRVTFLLWSARTCLLRNASTLLSVLVLFVRPASEGLCWRPACPHLLLRGCAQAV